jgi:hypothetical protein
MLKKKLRFFAALLLMLSAAVMLSACAPGDGLPGGIAERIAELRTDIYAGADAGNTLNVITGRRESPYRVDGKPGTLTDYTVITYTPATVLPTVGYTYRLTAEGKVYTGGMELHPMGTSFAADLGTTLKGGDIEVVIADNAGGAEQLYTLSGKFKEDMISWTDAVKVAADTLSEPLSQFYDGKKLIGEVFIKLTNEPQNSDSLYWYVAFTDGTKTIAALVDAKTGQVVASRNA